MRNFRVIAQAASNFPLEQHTWENIGHLIQYDWGLSAYVYLQNSSFYYMIEGGSEYYNIWISLDPNDSAGFPINGMFADYILSTIGPEDYTSSSAGLHKWNMFTETWDPIVIATEQSGATHHSSDGSVAFSANQGKIDLSRIGNPDRIWLVLEANEAGPIRVPQNGFAFLDITNKFAAAFTVQKEIGLIPHPGTAFPREPQSWVIDRLETANATLFFKNYGAQSIQNIEFTILVPPEVNILSGSTSSSSTSIAPDQNKTFEIQVNRTGFGTSTLVASFTYNNEKAEMNEPIILQQKLTMVPRVDLQVMVPKEKLLWKQRYPINVTVTNLDPYAATVDLVPSASTTWQTHVPLQEVITVTINPLSTLTLYPLVQIEGSNVGYSVFFEETRLNWIVIAVNFTNPNIRFSEVLVDDEQYGLGSVDMEIGRNHTVTGTIQNLENVSYTVTIVLKEGSYSQIQQSNDANFSPYYSVQTVELSPIANTTVSFPLFVLESVENDRYTRLSLAIEMDQSYFQHTEISVALVSHPNQTSTMDLMMIIVLIILAGIVAKITCDAILRSRNNGEH
jgi:hypothetical protein